MHLKCNDLLEKYSVELLEKDFADYYEMAVEVLSDISYLKEHIERSKKSNSFNYEIIPRTKNLAGYPMRVIINKEPRYWLDNKDNFIKLMRIIDITSALLSNDYIGWGEDEDKVKKVAEWAKCFNYFTGINLLAWIGNFMECSTRSGEILNKVNDKVL